LDRPSLLSELSPPTAVSIAARVAATIAAFADSFATFLSFDPVFGIARLADDLVLLRDCPADLEALRLAEELDFLPAPLAEDLDALDRDLDVVRFAAFVIGPPGVIRPQGTVLVFPRVGKLHMQLFAQIRVSHLNEPRW
jgi:hypothetical protein